MSAPLPQPVITMADYVDGILSGVALFEGRPHVFLPAKGDAGDSRDRYELYAIAEIDPTFALEEQDLWNPHPSVRNLIDLLVNTRRGGHVVFGDFRPIGEGSARGPDAMEVLWLAV